MFDVITIGTSSRDAFIKSPAFKTISSPDFISGEGLCLSAGAKIELDSIMFSTGGGATNAAVTFARQNYHTAAVCKIGADVSGREIIANLQAENVETGFIIQDSALKTAYSILILSASGERTVLVFRGASEHFEANDFSSIDLSARWFYLTGFLSQTVLEYILDQAKKINARVAFNPSAGQIKLGLKSLGDILKKIDVLIMNREEGSSLTDIDYKRPEDILRCLDEYVDGIVVMTNGIKGVMVSDNKTIYKAGIYPEKKIADRTGAGDAFGSGFVAGLISQQSAISNQQSASKESAIEYAIRLGSANATSVVESIGAKTGILSREDLEKDARWQKLDIFKISIK